MAPPAQQLEVFFVVAAARPQRDNVIDLMRIVHELQARGALVLELGRNPLLDHLADVSFHGA